MNEEKANIELAVKNMKEIRLDNKVIFWPSSIAAIAYVAALALASQASPVMGLYGFLITGLYAAYSLYRVNEIDSALPHFLNPVLENRPFVVECLVASHRLTDLVTINLYRALWLGSVVLYIAFTAVAVSPFIGLLLVFGFGWLVYKYAAMARSNMKALTVIMTYLKQVK
jgi:hypothetical protein